MFEICNLYPEERTLKTKKMRGKRLEFDDGYYEGETQQNRPHGYGTYTKLDGFGKHEGDWVHGIANGYGKVNYKNHD